jgi:hypothetical protein
LKFFSLTSYNITYEYDRLVVPVLRRMKHLEKLTLYLRIRTRWQNSFLDDTNPFVDGTHLHNEILVHMSHLHAFIFYISTETMIHNSFHRKSNEDIQQTFTNIKYGQTACIIDDLSTVRAICYVYSLPFTFTRLEKITTHFPTIVFDTVTHLSVYDMVSMKHEFFMRISRAFPVLKCFSILNNTMQICDYNELISDSNRCYSIIEYSHLISLNITRVNIDCVVQFLLETKTHLPRLTELKVDYDQLKTVTMNFTRDATRRNCSKVKKLIVEEPRIFSNDVYQYFPLL